MESWNHGESSVFWLSSGEKTGFPAIVFHSAAHGEKEWKCIFQASKVPNKGHDEPPAGVLFGVWRLCIWIQLARMSQLMLAKSSRGFQTQTHWNTFPRPKSSPDSLCLSWPHSSPFFSPIFHSYTCLKEASLPRFPVSPTEEFVWVNTNSQRTATLLYSPLNYPRVVWILDSFAGKSQGFNRWPENP